MDLKTFLGRVLPSSGNYFLAHDKDNDNKPVARLSHATIDSLVTAIYRNLAAKRNVYYSTGSFGSSSKGDQLRLKRVFYVDIDCGPGKPYANKKEALQALHQAVKDGLPKPTLIVDSGNGLHVYWELTADIPGHEWKPYGKALQGLCESLGLAVDSQITPDAVRILRPVGTYNYKDPANPKPVKIVYDKGPVWSFNDFSAAVNAHLSQPAPVPAPVDNSDLSAGIEHHKGRPAQAKQMVAECPMLTSTLATGGAGQPGVFWSKILHLLAWCEDGADYIHPMSSGHAEYDPKKTEERFTYALTQRAHAEKNPENVKLGPTVCDTFAKYSPECATCKWRGKFKSPIKLAYGTPSELPAGWRNGEKGLQRYIPGEDGEQGSYETVARFTVHDLSIAIDHGRDTHLNFMLGDVGVTATLADFESSRSTYLHLCKFNRGMENNECSHLKTLMNTWAQQLQHNKKTIRRVTQYGWFDKNKFHLPGYLLSLGDKGLQRDTAFIVDQNMHDTMAAVGDLEPWTECANYVLKQPRPAAWAILASAFAAPLINFTALHGTLLSAHSPSSGSGKSTMIAVAQAVWGHPVRGISSLNDTANAVTNRLGMLNTLPAYWDEVREKQEVIGFIKNVFRLGQGKEKQRLNANAQQRSTGTWSTMMVVASNEPLMDHIAANVTNTDAGVARVFEIKVEDIPVGDGMTNTDATHFYGRLQHNYGRAGEVYAAHLVEHRELAARLVKKLQERFEKVVNSESACRFWVATASSLLAGAMLANRAGLTQFDLPTFELYLTKELQRMYAVKQGTKVTGSDRAVELMGEFLHLHSDSFVKSKYLSRVGRPGSKDTILSEAVRGPAIGRVAVEDKAIRILDRSFKHWLYERDGAGYSNVIESLVKQGAREVRGSIDNGTLRGTGGRPRCIEFDLTGPFADVYDLSEYDEPINADLSS